MSAGMGVSLVYLLRRHGLLPDANTIVLMAWGSNNEWLVVTRDGREFSASLQKPIYLQAWIVILIFILNDQRRPIIILPDALDRDSFRRLRVRLQLDQNKVS